MPGSLYLYMFVADLALFIVTEEFFQQFRYINIIILLTRINKKLRSSNMVKYAYIIPILQNYEFC